MNYEEFQKFKESSDEEKIAHLTTPDSTPAVNLDQLAEDLGPMGLNVPKEMGGYVVRPGLSAYASALGAAGGALKKSGHIFGIPIDTLWNKTRNIGNYLGLTEPEVRTEDTLQAEETPWQPLQDKAADYFLNSAKTVMGLEKEMKTPLTDPYADAGASLMFGMGGAAVAHQMAKKTITSLAARQAMNKGQSLAIGGSTAMAGDYVINRTLEQLDPVIEASGMSDNAKMLIKASIGIGLGFASGLTFETKIAKMMGDPLFVAFVESVAKRGGSSIDILDEMRHRQPEEFTDLDNLDKLIKDSTDQAYGRIPEGIDKPKLGETYDEQRGFAPQEMDAKARWKEEHRQGRIKTKANAYTMAPLGVLNGVEVDENGDMSFDDQESIKGILAASALAGITRMRVRGRGKGRTTKFTHYDPFPSAKRSKDIQKFAVTNKDNPLNNNDPHRKLAADYTTLKKYPIGKVEDGFMQTVNRDKEGLSLFDRIWEREVNTRMKALLDPSYAPYKPITMNISAKKSASGNIKAEGEYLPLDTSRGCVNMCPECYAKGSATKSKRCFVAPSPVKLTGSFDKNPDIVRRFGEVGDPSIDATKFGAFRKGLETEVSAGKSFSPEELDARVGQIYDWDYFNQQLRNTGLDAPEAHNKVFAITKLNTLKNFDPNVIRNLEVSVDPLIPHHFFRSLKNVDRLLKIDPTLNIALRVRSVSSYSDEVNSLQKIAVEFANKHDLSVLETRLRFRGKEAMTAASTQSDYSYIKPQQWHSSSLAKTRAETKETSPLAQSGLKKQLHYACNETNLHTAACGVCQNCRKFVKQHQLKAIQSEPPGGKPLQPLEGDELVPRSDPQGTNLQLHPSTITGPIGAVSAGIDWDELQETGNIEIAPKLAVYGLFAGVAGGTKLRLAKPLARAVTSTWEKKLGEPIVEAAKRVGRFAVRFEGARQQLGMSKEPELTDLMREHKRIVQTLGTEALRIAKEIQEIAPTKATQQRLMRIIRGSVAGSSKEQALAKQLNNRFNAIREQLKEYDLLTYSQFDQLTRKERTGLRKLTSGPDPATINNRQALNDYATELGAKFRKTDSDDELRQTISDQMQFHKNRLNDYYHVGSNKEYLWKAYGSIEGATPAQKKAVKAEIRNLKVRKLLSTKEEAVKFDDMIDDLQDNLKGSTKVKDADKGNKVKQKRIDELDEKITQFEEQAQQARDQGSIEEAKSLDNYKSNTIRTRDRLSNEIIKQKKSRGAFKSSTKLRSSAKLDRGYAHRLKDIPNDLKRLMDPVENPAYLVGKSMQTQVGDIQKAKLFRKISENPAWAIEPKRGQDIPAGFKLVQDKRLGDLHGKLVRKDVITDLSEVEDMRNSFIRGWDKMLGVWKYGKVILNPATHARNFMSNTLLAYLGDVNPADVKTYTKAVRALKQGADNPDFKEAQEWGLFNNTFYSAEIARSRDQLAAIRDPGKLKDFIRKATSAPADAYQGQEKMFKMAVFIKARADGLSVDAAGRKAQEFLFDYGDIPPAVRHMKRWVSPFFTFTYKALPLFAKMVVKKPWKVAAIGGAMYAMEEFARKELGKTKEQWDKERKQMPEFMQNRVIPTLGLGEYIPEWASPYANVRLPWKDKWGNPLSFDMSYILPYGTMGEKWGQSGLPFRDFMPSGPVWDNLIAIKSNIDTFTGKEIHDKILDTLGDHIMKRLDYAYKSIMPSLAPQIPGTRIKGGYSYDKIATGIKNLYRDKDPVLDWADRPQELPAALISTMLGIKLSPIAERKLAQSDMYKFKGIKRAVGKRIGELKRQRRRNMITVEEFQKEVTELQNTQRLLVEEIGE